MSESVFAGWIVDGYMHAEVSTDWVEVRRFPNGDMARYVREPGIVHCSDCRFYARYKGFECCEVRPAAGRFKVPANGFCNFAERRGDG